jgi:diguanylate cyclase (GGDEF)-like protein
MENEKNSTNEDTESVAETNVLRKYSISNITTIASLIAIFLLWKYTYTSINYAVCGIVFLLSIFTGYYTVRINSRFEGNEFCLDDYAIFLGICFLDPFQVSLAFATGISIAFAFKNVPFKRIFLNFNSNVAVVSIAAIIVRSPLNIDEWHFPLLAAAALTIYFFLDPISFYFVCKFPAKQITNFLLSRERGISLIIGLVIGVPTALSIRYYPIYAFINFAIFFVACLSFNSYQKLLTSRNQLEQIVNFITDSEITNNKENSESRLVEMTKSAFRHDSVRMQISPPNKTQIGKIIYTDDIGDHWLIIDKYDFSKSRLNQDNQLLVNIVAASKRAFEHKELQEQLFKAARYDSLTGLSNRGTLEEYVERELGLVKREQTQFCLMFIDIDEFKPVNDTYGHKAGDELLKCIARRLELTVRTQDVVSRIGGDEFVILCRDININDAEELAIRISDEINKPVFIGSQEENNRTKVSVSSSIGISIAPADGISFETLLKTADDRMYRAKKSKKNVRIVSADKKPETKTA